MDHRRVDYLLLACLWSSVFGVVRPFNVHVSPDRARVMQTVAAWVNVTCRADGRLAGCQFTWWADKETQGPVLDLSSGAGTVADPTLLGAEVLDYRFGGGADLARGHCALDIKVKGKKLWVVGCRARAEAGGWRYGWMDLVAYATSPLPDVAVSASQMLAFPGQELHLMCSVPQPVNRCFFSVPGVPGWLDFNRGLLSRDSTGRHVCRGTGPGAGQCGLSLSKVKDTDSGPVRCYVWRHPNLADNRVIHVLVAKAPSSPRLEVSYEGGVLNATCSVGDSRPAVGVRWVLGDEVVRNDDVDDAPATPTDPWAWPWSSVGVTQKYSRRLQPGDYGKVFKCVVSHVALRQPLELAQIIVKPKENEKPRVVGATPVAEGPSSTACGDLGVSCPDQAEYCLLRVEEARRAASAARLAEQANNATLQAAMLAVRAETARAEAEESRAREEAAYESWLMEQLRGTAHPTVETARRK